MLDVGLWDTSFAELLDGTCTVKAVFQGLILAPPVWREPMRDMADARRDVSQLLDQGVRPCGAREVVGVDAGKIPGRNPSLHDGGVEGGGLEVGNDLLLAEDCNYPLQHGRFVDVPR